MTTKEPRTVQHITVAITKEDERWLARYREEVHRLAGLVVECVNDNPVTLLSPLHREMITRQARLVQRMDEQLAGMQLYVDNLGPRQLDDRDNDGDD